MDNEILLSIKEISLEGVIIAFLVFGLTMLIKWPIKKLTAKFDENKRKAINTVIVFIPMILSLILNMLYFGLFKSQWFTPQMLNNMAGSYLLTVGIYAVYTRIVILIQGAKGEAGDSDLSKEAIACIKENSAVISQTLKVDEQKLNEVVSSIESLINMRNEITSNVMLQNIPEKEKIDSQIEEMTIQKNYYLDKISKNQEKLENLQKSIEKENY